MYETLSLIKDNNILIHFNPLLYLPFKYLFLYFLMM